MKNTQPDHTKNSLGNELLLWGLASVLSCCAAVGGAYAASTLGGWRLSLEGFAVAAALILSLTWGSWASLVWTENRAVRVAMKFATLIPSLLMLAAGIIGFYAIPGRWFIWAGLFLMSAATLTAAITLSSDRIMRMKYTPGSTKYLFGFFVFPVLTTIAAIAVAYLAISFITQDFASFCRPSSWRSLFRLSTFMISMMSTVLITTFLPAAISRSCRNLAAKIDGSSRE